MKKTYVYWCWDAHGQLLYVGVAEDIEARHRQHAREKFWWPDVAKVTRMAFPTRLEAEWAEWAVIATCSPVYNRRLCPPGVTPSPSELAADPTEAVEPPVPDQWFTTHATRIALVQQVHHDWVDDPSLTSVRAIKRLAIQFPEARMRNAICAKEVAACIRALRRQELADRAAMAESK